MPIFLLIMKSLKGNTRKNEAVNLEEFLGQGTIFSGRQQGEEARRQFNIDQLDASKGRTEILIPEKTTSLNPSFMLGLFFQSIKKLKENFRERYQFILLTENDQRREILMRDIEDFYRQASLEINHSRKSIFDFF